MFGKSLKYEFKAIARKVVPLFITVLVLSVILSIGFIIDGRLLPDATADGEASVGEAIMNLAQGIFTTGLFIMIFVAGITVFVMTIKRFYTSFFTDEGYLTFTLPVTVNCHIMTKIVSMILWNLMGAIVTIIAYLIMIGGIEIGYGTVSGFYAEFADELSYLITSLSGISGDYTGSIVLLVIYAIVSYIFEVLLIYFGISLGCMWSKKHRVVASIACIFGVNIVFSILESIIETIVTVSSVFTKNLAVASVIMLASLTVLGIVKVMLSYIGIKAILTKKLNLD